MMRENTQVERSDFPYDEKFVLNLEGRQIPHELLLSPSLRDGFLEFLWAEEKRVSLTFLCRYSIKVLLDGNNYISIAHVVTNIKRGIPLAERKDFSLIINLSKFIDLRRVPIGVEAIIHRL